jgi:ABC-2 type transport system ATP-binding protein
MPRVYSVISRNDLLVCEPDVRDLSVVYGTKKAVDDVSLEIARGEIFGLLGHNGAGKTSTLSAIEGLIKPKSGTVLLDGIDIRRHPAQAKAKVGVQLQATSFQSPLTIKQIVRLYAGLYGVALSDAEITKRWPRRISRLSTILATMRR